MTEPRPLKVTLLSQPTNPLETLFVVWEQSRSNKRLPSPHELHMALRSSKPVAGGPENILTWGNDWAVSAYGVGSELGRVLTQMGYPATPAGHKAFVDKFDSTIAMIMAESIPVTENLYFVFQFENIPISLREQLVRHRVGNHVGPGVSFDIIPELTDSTFWSQTSRVIPFDTFFDEGRYLIPEGMAGKRVKDDYLHLGCSGGEELEYDEEDECVDAQAYYRDTLSLLQHRYKMLMEAGVHIEDCRQLVPVGATHAITWGINLKAMLHIMGKRGSWIAQIGLWGEALTQMTEEMVTKVHPVFASLGRPACIKNGKFTGCPVNGTNVERVVGSDGMPPCPVWIRYQTADAVAAARSAEAGEWKEKGREHAAWFPPRTYLHEYGDPVIPESDEDTKDARNWICADPVQVDMLNNTAAKFGRIWHLDVFNPGLEIA